MKVLLLTAYDASLAPLARFTVPRMAQYADRNQCELRVVAEAECDRPGAWIKIPAIRQALDEDFDYVLWLDADTLFIRHDIDIRSAISPSADLHMTWHGPDTADWQAPSGLAPHFNAGVMLIRNAAWSREFFKRTWEIGQIGDHGWRDQATILHQLGYDNLLGLGPENPSQPDRTRVTRLDAAWNSIPGIAIAPDPIINHYAGMDESTRLRLIAIDCETLPYRENASGQARILLSRQLSAYAKERRVAASEWGMVRGELAQARAALEATRVLALQRLAEINLLADQHHEEIKLLADQRHEEIKSLVDQLAQAGAELKLLRSSLSWTMTRPLREVVRFLRRIRRVAG